MPLAARFHAAQRGATAGPPIGFVSAWIDPTVPRRWAGIPHGLIGGLTELGVYAGWLDATPPGPLVRVVYERHRRRGRLTAWTLEGAMRPLTAVSNLAARWMAPREVAGWVVPASGIGTPVRRGILAVVEVPPSKLEEMELDLARSFWSRLSERGRITLVRRQRSLLRRADAICCPSSWARDALVERERIDPARIHVVGYGRNVEVDAPPDRDWRTPRFLFMGRDWGRKNGEAVLRAFSELRREFPEATLDLVGDHPAVDLEGVTGHGPVSYAGAEGRVRLEGLLRDATCLVAPSLIEPFGIVYLEAGHAGVPSIATNVGGTATSVGEGGRLVDPTDGKALLEAMRELARPEVARELGATARARAGLFGWRQMAERVLRAFAFPEVDAEDLAAPL